MSAELTDVLRQTRLLSSVPDEDLAELAGASRVRVFRRGQVVCTMGDPGDTLIVVISGRVKIAIRSADGGELTLAVIGPGGAIGEVSVADGGPRSADAETLEDSQLLLVPREPVQDICARAPAAAQALASIVAATLRRLTDATADLVFLDLPRRVAKVLLSQSRDGEGVIWPHLTQEQLARQAAGSRQSVNAALQGFERRGWIAVNGRAVTVRQPQLLARFAGSLGAGRLTGDWNTAGDELNHAIDADGLGGIEYLACYRAWLAALRGDTPAAQAALAGLGDLRASEARQDKALVAVVEAFTATARRQPAAALRHARATLSLADSLGISHDCLRWAWPLAARAAWELNDTAAAADLLATLDDYQPGQLAPMQRAERDLARARLSTLDGGSGTGAAFAAAVAGLRQQSTPYHLAHGLLDHAAHYAAEGDAQAAAAAISEASGIAARLGCQPLHDRAASMTAAGTRLPA